MTPHNYYSLLPINIVMSRTELNQIAIEMDPLNFKTKLRLMSRAGLTTLVIKMDSNNLETKVNETWPVRAISDQTKLTRLQY